jgi:hypothetical protein
MGNKYIRSFVVNLNRRTGRRAHTIKQFADREEFQMNLVKAVEHPVGAIGLWITIRHILKDLVEPQDEYIILCQDDHLFTKGYSKEYLLYCINEAQLLDADILSCGISGFTSAIKVSKNLYWVEKFSGLQFAVIFRKFFQTILDANYETVNAADLKLCALTENKFFIYPFLSIQKEFGYSDVTAGNNAQGHIDNAFKDCNEKVTILKTVSNFYKQRLEEATTVEMPISLEGIIIPTYILYFAERKEQLSDTEKQFAGRKEFDVKIIEACHHKNKELALWLSIKKIIETAIENDDDVIIICREEHEFTKHYERDCFIPLIWEAGILGCNVLIGGIEAFNLALPITNNIFWIDSFRSSKFFVIYKSFYKNILQEPFGDSDTLENKFSEMTSSKMALHPFISEEKDFEDISITNKSNFRNVITQHPKKANDRLVTLKNVWNKFNCQTGEEY